MPTGVQELVVNLCCQPFDSYFIFIFKFFGYRGGTKSAELSRDIYHCKVCRSSHDRRLFETLISYRDPVALCIKSREGLTCLVMFLFFL